MPTYYVYNTANGEVLHRHESVDGTSGTSLSCSREDVLAMVDEGVSKEELDIIEHPGDRQEVGRVARVDLETGTLTSSE